MYSTHTPSVGHVKALSERLPVRVARSEVEAVALGPDTTIIFGHRYLRQALSNAPHLRWVQSTAGGVDRLPLSALSAQGVCLTRNIWDAPVVAQHALKLLGDLAGESPVAVGRAVILGTGHIGAALAQLLSGLGWWVGGVNTNGRDVAGFDRTYGAASWRRSLGDVDVLFDTLPCSASTEQIIDSTVFSTLPSKAFFVSVGRATTVCRVSLIRALEQGQIRGAASDVFKPTDPALINCPGLILTPYIASHSPDRGSRLERAFEVQLDRFLSGAALEGVVHLTPRDSQP